jgi:hypothetical protein
MGSPTISRVSFDDLLGQPVPDRSGYTFGTEVSADGDIRYVPIYRDSDGEEIGQAEGRNADEWVRTAQAAVDRADRSQE